MQKGKKGNDDHSTARFLKSQSVLFSKSRDRRQRLRNSPAQVVLGLSAAPCPEGPETKPGEPSKNFHRPFRANNSTRVPDAAPLHATPRHAPQAPHTASPRLLGLAEPTAPTVRRCDSQAPPRNAAPCRAERAAARRALQVPCTRRCPRATPLFAAPGESVLLSTIVSCSTGRTEIGL